MTSISGINIEDMAQWGEPSLDSENRLVRYARPSRLWRVLWQARPADLRKAGIFFRKEGETSYLIQSLDRIPEPRVLAEAAKPVTPTNVKVDESGLLAWQPDPLRRLVSFWKSGSIATADFSDTGVG
jgi:hypothetical protein